MAQVGNQPVQKTSQGTAPETDIWVTTPRAYGPGEGWIYFSGVALVLAGVMRFFDSMWAFAYNGTVPSNLQNALFGTDLSTYGWLWLGVSIILFLAGLGVFVRSQVSRWIGVFAGGIGAISAIWWMPYYPVWSLTYIVICMLVVYGLAAHGQRQATA